MQTIPLPKGITGLDDHPKQKEYLVNLIWTKSGLMRTPGIKLFAKGFGACRGAIRWKADNASYMVSGNRFISINSNGAVTDIGEISGTADCFFSEGQVNLVIGVKGGDAYRYNSTEGLVQIIDPDFMPSVAADFIDGRHVFIPFDGSPPFYSGVDQAGAFEPLSFFDAEELPDLNRSVINISNQLYVTGGDSSEVFRTNIDPDKVFSRREGSRVDVGFISGLVRYRGTFAFIGRRRGESIQIFVMGSGDAQEISTPAIDEILRKEYSLEEIEAVDSFRYKWNGLEILCFNFARHTLSFNNGNWFYSSSGVTRRNWRVKGLCHSYGKYIFGDRDGPNIGIFYDGAQEYGADIETEIKTFIRSGKGSHFKVRKIEADMRTGTSSGESIGISISKDSEIFNNFHYRSMGKAGEKRRSLRWQPPGGIGKFESFAGLRVRSTSPTKTSLEFLSFE